VIKREVMEGDKAEQARKKITKTAGRALKAKAAKSKKQGSESTFSGSAGIMLLSIVN
jgi:hypothetical protein